MWTVMQLCVRLIGFASFYHFNILFWQCRFSYYFESFACLNHKILRKFVDDYQEPKVFFDLSTFKSHLFHLHCNLPTFSWHLFELFCGLDDITKCTWDVWSVKINTVSLSVHMVHDGPYKEFYCISQALMERNYHPLVFTCGFWKTLKIFWITWNQDLSLRYPPSKLLIFQLYIPPYRMTN
jgi:hypothetical protein